MRKEFTKRVSILLVAAIIVTAIFGGYERKVSAADNNSEGVISERNITAGTIRTLEEENTKKALETSSIESEETTGNEPATEEPTSGELITEEPTTEEPTTPDYEIIDEVYKVKNGILIEYLGEKEDNENVNLIIPAEIKKIDDYVFDGYKNIKSVRFGKKSKLIEIGDYAFKDCREMTEITLPKGLKTIGYKALARCTSVKTLTIPATVTKGDTILGTEGKTKTVVFASGFTYIPDRILKSANSVSKITLYSGVKTIGSQAFYKCTALKSISLPDTVTNVKKSAFNSCTSLAKVTTSKNMTTIGSYAFKKCISLGSFVLRKTVKTIGTGAFSGDSKLNFQVYANSTGKAYARKNKFKWEYTSSEKKRREQNQTIYKRFTNLIKTADKNKYKLKYLNDYVPQGNCIIGKYLVISMYHKNLSKNSMLLIYNKSTGAYVKRVILPSRDHVGAVTNVKKRLVVSLNNTPSVDYAAVISYSRLKKIKSGKMIKYNYQINLSGQSDFAAFDGTYFWSGSSTVSYNGSMQGYKVTVKKKKLVFTKKYSYSIPENIQGLSVQKVTSTKRRFIFAKSYGRLNNSSLITYSVKIKSSRSLGKPAATKTLPSMLEGIVMSKGYLYFVFESGSGLYCGNPDNTSEIQIKNVCRIKYSKLG